jgi:hypothetical protein
MDELDSNFIDTFIKEIANVNKIKDQDKIDEIRAHLLFNIKIIRLSIKVFPDEIRKALEQHFETYSTSKFLSQKFTALKNNLSSL